MDKTSGIRYKCLAATIILRVIVFIFNKICVYIILEIIHDSVTDKILRWASTIFHKLHIDFCAHAHGVGQHQIHPEMYYHKQQMFGMRNMPRIGYS